jgi:ribosomal-protein-alanine N-acetyltransferase
VSHSLKPLRVAAIGSLAALHRQCFPEDPWDAAALTQIFGMPGFFGWIARVDEDPVGFALALDLRRECEILSLGVVPDRRRTGAGLGLLKAVCGEARRRRAERVVLEVAEDNAAARALYAAGGFVPMGRRPRYYQRRDRSVDALVLGLALAPLSCAS